jgi:hypothetical protein
MFSVIAGKTVRLVIEDPYLASGDRNRAALVQFIATLQDLKIGIGILSLTWKPARPGPGYHDERPEDQQRDLAARLKRAGLPQNAVLFKPRTGRGSHFHDRIITATVLDQNSGQTSYRWDITSGIDNLMERERQCSVFLSNK